MSFGSFVYDTHATLTGFALQHCGWSRHAHWSDEERVEYQYRHLKALLIDAADHVPYYRAQFRQSGFNPRVDFRALPDLALLPILSKDTVRKQCDALCRRSMPHRSILERTSGSTGEPLQVWISPRQIAVEKATVWRHWGWCGYRFRDPVAIVRTYVPNPGEPLWRYDHMRNFLYLSAYHLDRPNASEFLRRIISFQPRFLRGYPSSLSILADVAAETGLRPRSPLAIFTASETLTQDVRDRLTRTFEAPVCDWYGLAEQVVTASECPAEHGLHRNDDYGYWELLPVGDGTGRQRIIGTNLHNYAMPLIRYDTGDFAESCRTSRCPCGRSFVTLSRVAGRQDDDLVDPSGRRIPAVNFYSVFRDYAAVRRFQIVQERPDRVQVRLDADDIGSDDLGQLKVALSHRLGNQIVVQVVRGQPFEKNPHGKRRSIISRASHAMTRMQN